MRLAHFFDRNVAAAAEVLAGADGAALRKRMSKLAVCLAFDGSAATSREGRVTLELATDLLARFYPGLLLQPLDAAPDAAGLAAKLAAAARSIHPGIDLRPKPGSVVARLVVGATDPRDDHPRLFLGSDGWTALVDPEAPATSGATGNPFGAAAAACLGVARLFRQVFSEELGGDAPEGPVAFDALHGALGRSPAPSSLPVGIDLADAHLVGLGAIGRAAAWTLARAEGLRGAFHGVDHEVIEQSNLQRYVGSAQNDHVKRRAKTRSVARMFEGTSVEFVGHPETWGRYLANRGDCDLDLVAVALDTARDRIAVQACLPRRVVNAWTQPGDLGLSRNDFERGPCLACLYLPEGEVPSLSANVADALGLPEPEVRELLYVGFKVDRAFLSRVEAATGVPLAVLLPFQGEPLSSFYAKAVCGTVHFGGAGSRDRGSTAVPMAFQSAMAGVLLAVELVAASSPLRARSLPALTKLDLLRPLGPYLTEPARKHRSGRCLCQDPTYVSAYAAKVARLAA